MLVLIFEAARLKDSWRRRMWLRLRKKMQWKLLGSDKPMGF